MLRRSVMLLCGFGSASAFAYLPTGAIVIAQAGETFSCPAKALVWYKVVMYGFDTYYSDGVCPVSGSVVCAYNLPTAMYNGTLAAAVGNAGQCFVFAGQASSSGGGGSAAASAPVVEFGAPFNLSVADGGLVGGAIVAVWLAGWAFRALYQSLHGGDYNREDG